MTDRARLNAVLGKLGQGGKITTPTGGSPTELLTDLLRIIDETILARDLSFDAGGQKIVLHIAKRSLLGTSGSIEMDLAESNLETLTQLGEQLAQLILGAKKYTMKLDRPAQTVDPSAVGASVSLLANAWALVGDNTATTFPELLEFATSWAFWDGSEAECQTGGGGQINPDSIDRKALREISPGEAGAVILGEPGNENATYYLWVGDQEALLMASKARFGMFLAVVSQEKLKS